MFCLAGLVQQWSLVGYQKPMNEELRKTLQDLRIKFQKFSDINRVRRASDLSDYFIERILRRYIALRIFPLSSYEV
jgi:hypothetical protein